MRSTTGGTTGPLIPTRAPILPQYKPSRLAPLNPASAKRIKANPISKQKQFEFAVDVGLHKAGLDRPAKGAGLLGVLNQANPASILKDARAITMPFVDALTHKYHLADAADTYNFLAHPGRRPADNPWDFTQHDPKIGIIPWGPGGPRGPHGDLFPGIADKYVVPKPPTLSDRANSLTKSLGPLIQQQRGLHKNPPAGDRFHIPEDQMESFIQANWPHEKGGPDRNPSHYKYYDSPEYHAKLAQNDEKYPSLNLNRDRPKSSEEAMLREEGYSKQNLARIKGQIDSGFDPRKLEGPGNLRYPTMPSGADFFKDRLNQGKFSIPGIFDADRPPTEFSGMMADYGIRKSPNGGELVPFPKRPIPDPNAPEVNAGDNLRYLNDDGYYFAKNAELRAAKENLFSNVEHPEPDESGTEYMDPFGVDKRVSDHLYDGIAREDASFLDDQRQSLHDNPHVQEELQAFMDELGLSEEEALAMLTDSGDLPDYHVSDEYHPSQYGISDGLHPSQYGVKFDHMNDEALREHLDGYDAQAHAHYLRGNTDEAQHYAALYHTVADEIKNRTGVDPRDTMDGFAGAFDNENIDMLVEKGLLTPEEAAQMAREFAHEDAGSRFPSQYGDWMMEKRAGNKDNAIPDFIARPLDRAGNGETARPTEDFLKSVVTPPDLQNTQSYSGGTLDSFDATEESFWNRLTGYGDPLEEIKEGTSHYGMFPDRGFSKKYEGGVQPKHGTPKHDILGATDAARTWEFPPAPNAPTPEDGMVGDNDRLDMLFHDLNLSTAQSGQEAPGPINFGQIHPQDRGALELPIDPNTGLPLQIELGDYLNGANIRNLSGGRFEWGHLGLATDEGPFLNDARSQLHRLFNSDAGNGEMDPRKLTEIIRILLEHNRRYYLGD